MRFEKDVSAYREILKNFDAAIEEMRGGVEKVLQEIAITGVSTALINKMPGFRAELERALEQKKTDLNIVGKASEARLNLVLGELDVWRDLVESIRQALDTLPREKVEDLVRDEEVFKTIVESVHALITACENIEKDLKEIGIRREPGS